VRALGRILYSSHGDSRLRSCCGVASDRVGQTDENPGTMFTPFVMSESSSHFLSMTLGGNYSY